MDTQQTITPAYDQLIEQSANPRQRTSLERIKAACDFLEGNGLKVSPASVERYCLDRQWDGPKAQSIRNSTDVLMRYLQLRQSSQKWSKPAKAGSGKPKISDESLRSYVQLLKEERDQAVAEKTRIEAGLRKLPGISVDRLLRGEAVDALTPGLGERSSFAPNLQIAVGKLMDPVRLSACGMELFKGRLRQMTTRNVLLERDDVETLLHVLDAR